MCFDSPALLANGNFSRIYTPFLRSLDVGFGFL